MKIYVLQGKHDVGKSLTLATLFTKYAKNMKILKSYNDYDVPTIEKHIEEKYKAIRNNEECISPYVLSVAEYNGIIIGLHTSGDDKLTVEKSIKLFNGELSENPPCDIGFCAVRTRGITVKTIEKLRNQGNEVIFIKQPVVQQWKDSNAKYQILEKSNTEQAEYLLSLLNDFLGIKL